MRSFTLKSVKAPHPFPHPIYDDRGNCIGCNFRIQPYLFETTRPAFTAAKIEKGYEAEKDKP